MLRYRYRTRALLGPWRTSAREAARDAVLARQALEDEQEPFGIRWRLQGVIEEAPRERPASLH